MKKPTMSLFLKGTLLTLVLVFVFSAVPIKPVSAQVDTIGGPVTVVMNVVKKVTDKLSVVLKKVGSTMVQTAITNSLKRVAYDTATWIGSGGEGQKPLFVTEGVGSYLGSIADSAAGDYIDAFASNLNVDFCEPNLDAKIKIGLGLVNQETGKIKDSKCKASTMFKAWKTDINAKYEAMKSPTFLKDMSSMFEVGGSDISVALNVMDGVKKEVFDAKEKEKLDLSIEGWLPNKNIGGRTTEAPGTAKLQIETAVKTTAEGQKVNISESPVTDAAKVFLNTLAATAFNKAVKQLASGDWEGLTFGLYKDKTEEEIKEIMANGGRAASSNVSCLNDPNCDPSTLTGASSVKTNLADMIKPAFDSRGDYDILSELAVCPDPSKPGPTNCILDEQFSSAISEHKTVIEAIKENFLNKNWRLKRDVDLNQGYSLRSLLVLRKFRIIPVGWETALLKAEENESNATLMDMVSCFDPNDNYNEFSQGFAPSTWCQGLIDPNWVLKAPLNYCKRQGYGNQILDKTIIPGQTTGGVEVPGEVIVTRADEYCADEQSCIKEKADGTCEAYGYCTEEKRTWDFASDSCDAINNTCQSFVKSNGASIAYLENTLDYSTCNADNAGCRPYSASGAYNTSSDKIAWNNLSHIYFSKKAEACDASQEGCNEVIRITPETGHNFLINSDFESYLNLGSWNLNTDISNASVANSATTTPDGYFSNNSLLVNGILRKNVAVGPNDYNISGRTYTLSFYAKNCSAGDKAVLGGINVDDKVLDLGEGPDWNYYYITYNFPLNLADNHVYFSVQSNTCQIDRVKLELAGIGTEYSNYYQNNLAYQKLIPDYLASACYANPNSATPDYRLKADAPAKCSNYTRRCNASEVDCDMYKSVRDGYVLPAKVTPFDSCFAECDGYDTYVQKETPFHNTLASNLIPTSATNCSANVVGCTEFTNLDSVAQGGEGKEYYSFLRQCIKPDNNQCGIFYSWGSASSGYELQPYKLQAFNDKPVLTSGSFVGNNHNDNGAIVCSEAIFNTVPSDAAYNSDCRQLYNKDGAIYYALYSKTITCSDDCHTYRISENPIDESITSPAACTGIDKNWNASSTVCFVCKNGGTWDENQNSCIYQAIPGEGKTCTAAENGCREYNGNYGNNLRIVSAYDFENNRKWSSFKNDSSSLSTDSINKNGHSLQYITSGGSGSENFNLNPLVAANTDGGPSLLVAIKGFWNKIVNSVEAQSNTALPPRGIGITVGNTVRQNSSYVVRFLAKAGTNVSVNVYLANGTVASQFNADAQNNGSVSVSGNNEWKLYSMNLASLGHEVNDQEALIISASNGLLLDNITLTEVTDRFYLIKDSWVTPGSCYYDTFNQYQGVNYNLGCSAYTNRANQVSYLRNFNKLCQDSAAGCELMALTNNSSDPGAQAFNEVGTANNDCDASDGASCVEVPADKMIYVVFDGAKQCGSDNKGCTRLGGQSATNPDVTVQALYSDVYIKNNPDRYESTLCSDTEVGCDEWRYLNGQSSYFKDPGSNVCEWRKPLNATGMNLPQKWYKKAIKRCDLDNNGKINVNTNGAITEAQNKLCSANSDCPTGSCILDKNDYLCTVDSLKTIGLGGGNLVYQPKDMAGICEAKASGCTEYVDPVSEFSPNLVINPTWGDINKDDIKGDGWSTSTVAGFTGLQRQTIYLLKNKLYSFSVSGSATQNTTLSCPASVRVLSSDNVFTAPSNTVVISGTGKNVLFNSLNNVSCAIYGGQDGKTINIRPTVVDYKLLAGIDKTTCNGAVSFDNGCIMFNEKKQGGSAGLSDLNWKAYGNSYAQGSPENATTDADSNVLVKVKPDRACSKWLSCMSMGVDAISGEETCYALGECDKLGDSGRCQSFISKPEVQHTFDSGSDRNIAGYSKMNNYYLSNMSETDTDPNQHWDFESASPADATNLSVSSPAGFNPDSTASVVLDSSNLGPASKISYPAIGRGILAISGSYLSSPQKGVRLNAAYSFEKNKKYYVNFLVNIDDSGGNGATIRLKSGIIDLAFMTVNTGSGWQRKVLEFTPTQNTGSVSIYLFSGNNVSATSNTVYFDDVNIEPVLKISDNTFVAKECRLYPKQDSLACKSSDANVISNGIYGYCLEHDPKNPDVCLMWFPVDNVKSSQASTGTNTAFNGYASGPTPSYCGKVSANFIFVEKRIGYQETASNSNCEDIGEGCSASPSGNGKITCAAGYNPVGTHCKCTSGCNWGYHKHWWKDVCAPSGTLLYSTGNGTISDSGDGCGSASISYPQGWYMYNGSLAGSEVLKVLDLNITNSSQCSNAGGDGIYYFSGYGSGCLMDVSEYEPKCIGYLTTKNSPWVKRLNNIPSGTASFWEIANNSEAPASGPYKNYSYTRGNNDPYGPASTTVIPANLGVGAAGVPYGCESNGRTYVNQYGQTVSTCEAIVAKDAQFSTFGIAVATTPWNLGLNASNNDPAKAIKNIFLQFVWAGTTYNYAGPDMSSGYNASSIQLCTSGGNTTKWCAIKPVISNIKLSDPDGKIIIPDPITGAYFVKDTGFYNLSFGVTVNEEQTPISKLLIDFDENPSSIISIPPIDPNNNFSFMHYYSPVAGGEQHHIRLNVADNWGFYACTGLASSCSTTNQGKCCVAGFDPNKALLPGQDCFGCLN